MTLCSFNAIPTDEDQQRRNVDIIGSDLRAMGMLYMIFYTCVQRKFQLS